MDETDTKPTASHYFQSESASIFDEFKQQPTEDLTLKSDESVKQPPLYFSPPTTSFSYIGAQSNLPLIESVSMGEGLLAGSSSSIEGIPLPSGGTNTDGDRTCDAWIPSKATREALNNLDSTGGQKLDKNQLVSPGIAMKEDFGDPVRNLVEAYLGKEAVSNRRALQASDVTQDDRGLRQLIATGCYHAAVNLTTQLLSVYGQGNRRAGQVSKHTVHSLQLWFTRISLLVKLRRFSFAEVEVEPLGNLDSPDLYFEFYPDLYGGRKGTLVPFSFRLLVAELPQYLGKHSQALDRLCKILAICNKILENLSSGLSEDGSEPAKKVSKEVAMRVWSNRRAKILFSLARCAVSLKDFRLASTLLQRLLQEEADMAGLFSAVGRLYLHLGDIQSAQEAFKRYLEYSPTVVNYDPVHGLLHSSFIASAQNDFENAMQILQQAYKVAPENALVINNLGVCMMFVGKIREAIQMVEKALFGNPEKLLHEALVLNLATMYELESSAAHKKKLNILSLVAAHKGDGFNVAALKLQV